MKHEAILLTGGTGFLGSHILRLLLKKKIKVVLLERSTSSHSRIEDVIGDPNLFKFNVSDGIEQCFQEYGITHIIHTATVYGRQNESAFDVVNANLTLPLELLKYGLQNGIKGFLNADTFFNEQLQLKPKEQMYTITKKSFLSVARGLVQTEQNFKFLNFRIQQMYGPEDKKEKFVAYIIAELLSGRSPIKLTSGEQKRDFVYVEDVAEAFVSAVKHFEGLENYEEFGIGSGSTTSIKEAVLILKDICHSEAELQFGALPQRANEIMDSHADLSNNGKINWKAVCPLKKGLQETVDSFIAHVAAH